MTDEDFAGITKIRSYAFYGCNKLKKIVVPDNITSIGASAFSTCAKLYKTYSDANKYIRKAGTQEEYAEAIDVENAPYTYEETDKDVPKIERINTDD